MKIINVNMHHNVNDENIIIIENTLVRRLTFNVLV
jgi:hypothetical protein